MSIRDSAIDLLGVGFGPAAIAVAAAIEDEVEAAGPGATPLSTRFLETAETSAWKPTMLLPGTDIQHHFLRDLATPRNPRSRFTFPSYLVDTDRLYPFTALNYISRHEWSEYVSWAARRISLPVSYTTEAVEVEPVREAGRVVAARVHARDTVTGETSRHLARNVLVSTGHTPHVPDPFLPHLGDRVFHSSEFLPRVADLPPGEPRRVVVVGAGQNAGEIFLHLARTLPHAEIHSLARNSGFRLYDLGHFSNEAYFPAETDYFYSLDARGREKVLGEVYATNYACVDPDVSTDLYKTVYEDQNWGPGRLHVRKRTAVDACAPAPGGGYRLALREVNTGATEELTADMVVLCTGFAASQTPALLDPFKDHIERDADGEPAVNREFRLGVTPDCEVGLYLNGSTEWRHGINSAASFSTVAVRAADILRDLRTRVDISVPAGA